MNPLLLIGLNFLKKYWLPITIFVVASFLIWSYGHKRYLEGKKEVQIQLAQTTSYLESCKASYKQFTEQIRDEMEAQQKILDDIRKSRTETITKVQKNYRDRINQVVKQNKSLQERINNETPSTAVIVAPDSFRMFYNEAVDNFRREGSEGGSNLPGNTGKPTGATETFEASALTQVAIENILQYNSLADQCNALIDIIVKEKERRLTK